MNQIKIKNEENDNNVDEQDTVIVNYNYSCSFPFVYKSQFKHDETRRNDGYRTCDLHVPPKYSSLKDEITSDDNVCFISLSK